MAGLLLAGNAWARPVPVRSNPGGLVLAAPLVEIEILGSAPVASLNAGERQDLTVRISSPYDDIFRYWTKVAIQVSLVSLEPADAARLPLIDLELTAADGTFGPVKDEPNGWTVEIQAPVTVPAHLTGMFKGDLFMYPLERAPGVADSPIMASIDLYALVANKHPELADMEGPRAGDFHAVTAEIQSGDPLVFEFTATDKSPICHDTESLPSCARDHHVALFRIAGTEGSPSIDSTAHRIEALGSDRYRLTIDPSEYGGATGTYVLSELYLYDDKGNLSDTRPTLLDAPRVTIRGQPL
jgi:hypothetical protein